MPRGAVRSFTILPFAPQCALAPERLLRFPPVSRAGSVMRRGRSRSRANFCARDIPPLGIGAERLGNFCWSRCSLRFLSPRGADFWRGGSGDLSKQWDSPSADWIVSNRSPDFEQDTFRSATLG